MFDGFEILYTGEGKVAADVVFVHGLQGNRITSWSKSKPAPDREPVEGNGDPHDPGYWLTTKWFNSKKRPRPEDDIDVLWPKDLLPQKIKNIRILTYGYDSQLTRLYKNVNKNGIYQHAENLVHALARERLELGSDSKLIFVCHSMGGIIVKDMIYFSAFLSFRSDSCEQALRQSKEATRHTHLLSILDSTYGIVFLGCPHRGSDVTNWGLLAANMLKLAGMSSNEDLIRSLGIDSQTLQMVNSAFSIIFREKSLKIHSFREEKGMSGIKGISGKVVGDMSAIIGDADEGKEGINGNHSDMCKFASLEDEGFRKVAGVLSRYVQEITKFEQKHRETPLYRALVSGLEDPKDILTGIFHRKGFRSPETCEWILREQKYKSWLLSQHYDLLWLYGDPGIGKTMLATQIIERLQQRAKAEGTMIVVYHFCDHQDKQKNIPCSILRGLISQLVEADPALIKSLEKDYERAGNDMFSNFRIMVRLFVDIVNGMRPQVPYCVIDGLDECDSESIPLLLREMFAPRHSTTTTEPSNFKLALISRRMLAIEQTLSGLGLEGYFDTVSIGKEMVRADIDKFIQEKISGLSYPEGLSNWFVSQLSDKAEGSFLWVALTVERLRNATASDIQTQLQLLESPHKMFDFYKSILEKIHPNHKDTVLEILELILGAVRPLTVSELATVRSVLHVNSSKGFGWQTCVQTFEQDLKWCRYLVTVQDQKVSLVHFTAKEYLLDAAKEIGYRIDQTVAHAKLAAASFSFFTKLESFVGTGISGQCVPSNEAHIEGYDSFCTPPTTLGPPPNSAERHSFLRYAIHHWIDHFEEAASSEIDIDWGHKFFDNDSPLRDTWLQAYWASHEQSPEFPKKFTALHIASYCGSKKLAEKLFSVRSDLEVDSVDDQHRSPLFMAASRSRVVVAEYLLESRRANVSIMDDSQFRPLDIAVCRGDTEMVTILLKHGASTFASSPEEPSPLHICAQPGFTDIAEILLQNGANVNLKDDEGNTALHIATEFDHPEMVKLMLRHHASTTTTNELSQTPLIAGIAAGNMAVMRILLDHTLQGLLNHIARGHTSRISQSELVDRMNTLRLGIGLGKDWICSFREFLDSSVSKEFIEIQLDSYKLQLSRPMERAVTMRHLDIVKLLVEYGADVDKPGNSCSPLEMAVKKGYDDVLESLLSAVPPPKDAMAKLLQTVWHTPIATMLVDHIRRYGIVVSEVHFSHIAASFDASIMDMFLSLERIPSDYISENVLLAATRNIKYGNDILQLLLDLVGRFEITDNVLRAVANMDENRAHLVIPFLLERAANNYDIEVLFGRKFDAKDSAATRVLVVAAIMGSTAMETLLSKCPDIQVHEEVVVAFAKKSNMMRVLLSQRPDIQIPEEVLVTIVEYGHIDIIQNLLSERPDIQIPERALIRIVENRDVGMIRMVQFERPDMQIPEKALVTIVEQGDIGTIQMLLSERLNIQISERALVTIIERNDITTMYILLLERPDIQIPERVLVTIAEQHNINMIKLLLSQRPNIQISGSIVSAAIKWGWEREEFMEALFTTRPEIQITEEAVALVAREFDARMMRLLLSPVPGNQTTRPDIRITESIVVAAIGNQRFGKKILEYFLAIQPKFEVTEPIFSALAANWDRHVDTMELLWATPDIQFTKGAVATIAEDFKSSSWWQFNQLLERFDVPESFVIVAVGNRIVLEKLLAVQPIIQVTESIVSAIAVNLHECDSVMGQLLTSSKIRFTEGAVAIIAEQFHSDTMRLLLSQHNIQVTPLIVTAAKKNRFYADREGGAMLELLEPKST